MKPALFLSAPPIAFFAAAMLAGLVPPLDPAANSDRPIPSGPRKRAGVIENSEFAPTNIKSALSEMERRVVRFSSSKIEVLDAEGMESRLLLDLHKSPSGGGVEALNYSGRWARENPAEMFEWFIRQELVSSDLRKSLAAGLFIEWAKQDMAAALAAVTRISHAESRAQALLSTLEVLCQEDPVKARELLLQNINSLGALKSVEFEIFEPGKARTKLISDLPPGRLRSLLIAENISSLMRSGLGCGGDNSSYYAKAAIGTELWSQLSTEDRRELVDAGLRLSDFDEIQLDGLEDLIKQRAEASNDPRQASLFIDRYGISWAERDAAAALSWTMSHLKGKKRMEWSLMLIDYAGQKDFDAAMRVWRTLPEGTLREVVAKGLAEVAPADHETEIALLQDSVPKPGKW
jgi:hypothetical protein